MDRQTANELCRKTGVANVPPGVDPREWLDDNDVFWAPPDTLAARAEVAREVYSDRIEQAEADHIRLTKAIARLKEEGYIHTTAFGYYAEWTPLESGIWSAMSSAPNCLSGYFRLGEKRPWAVRYEYGNAVVYYVQPDALDGCVETWWIEQLRTGYRVAKGDPVAGVCWAARNALEMAEKYPNCLGGDDAVRFASKNAEKLRILASATQNGA